MINSIVKKGWVCLDIGSNIGIVTDMLANQVGPKGQVIAFEAFNKNAAQLKKYLSKEIKSGRVKVHNLAVSDGSADTCMAQGEVVIRDPSILETLNKELIGI